jgi:integrase/recombinase XerD
LELVNLQIDDLDIERRTVRIQQGKGKRDRVVPIGERALAWVEKYLDTVRPRFYVEPDDGIIFLTAVGNRLSVEVMTSMVRGYIQKAGIAKKGSCHLFRHTCATVMLEHGADVRYIQQMLGHRDMSSTEVYTHVSIEKLKEVHASTPPGAGLGRME